MFHQDHRWTTEADREITLPETVAFNIKSRRLYRAQMEDEVQLRACVWPHYDSARGQRPMDESGRQQEGQGEASTCRNDSPTATLLINNKSRFMGSTCIYYNFPMGMGLSLYRNWRIHIHVNSSFSARLRYFKSI